VASNNSWYDVCEILEGFLYLFPNKYKMPYICINKSLDFTNDSVEDNPFVKINDTKIPTQIMLLNHIEDVQGIVLNESLVKKPNIQLNTYEVFQ
jgi:hypothetical protein